MALAPFSRIGAHVPVSGGLAKRGLSYADAIGAEVIQVFVTNPRSWAHTPGNAEQDALLRARTDLPVFVHACYLINLGSPDEEIAARSVASLEYTLQRAAQIGARGVVVHTGSAVRGGRAAGLARVRARLLPILEALDEAAPPVLLEPMAGQGQVLCATVDDLADYLDAVDRHPKAGCLDTAHVSERATTSPPERECGQCWTGSARWSERTGCGWCMPMIRLRRAGAAGPARRYRTGLYRR